MRFCLAMVLAGLLLAGCAQRNVQQELYTQVYPITGTETQLALIDSVLEQEINRLPDVGDQYAEKTGDQQLRVRTTPRGHLQIREALAAMQARQTHQQADTEAGSED